MGEYERMVIDFLVIVAAPLLMAVIATVVAARVLIRERGAAVAPATVLPMVTVLAATASNRVVVVEKRARAPSSWETRRA